MSTLRLAMIQSELYWENPEANRAMFEEKIRPLSGKTDVIVLPEMFTTGFSMAPGELAEVPHLHTHRWMSKMAAITGAALTGSYIVKEGDMYFNRLLWVDPDGSYQVYNKKHLFRMGEENQHYSSGISRTLITFRDWKILPLICYDLRFPAWCRNHYHPVEKVLDYDLLLFVANWPAVRSEAWDSLLKARAIENHAYTVGLNRLGTDGKGKEYNGHSAVYEPAGTTLAFSSVEETIIIELEKEPLASYREKFPAYLDSND